MRLGEAGGEGRGIAWRRMRGRGMWVWDVGAGPVTTHNDFWRPDLSGNTLQTYHYLHYPRLRALSRLPLRHAQRGTGDGWS